MKIALLCASLRGGGAERVQITLAKKFKQLGHSVYFVVIEDDGPLLKDIPEDIEIFNFKVSRVVFGIFPLFQFFRKKNPDVVIAAMTHVGIVALLSQILACWSGKLLVRADGSRRYHSQSKYNLKYVVLYILQRFLLPKAYSVIGVSKTIAKEFQEDFALKNCHVIHNPVATSINQKNKTNMGNNSFFDDHRPVVIAIGRLVKQKGFSFLLKAFAVLVKKRESKLVILGEGNLRQTLEAEIEELGIHYCVSLPGFVQDPFFYLKRSSVYALSSESEPFGLSVVEALSVGLPVVCTDTEGPRDIINNDKLGEIVPYGNIELFAAAIGRALDEPDKNNQYRITRAAEFAPDRIVKQYLQLIGND